MIQATAHQCGYCHRYLPRPEMDAHARTCAKHPLSAALEENAALRALLDRCYDHLRSSLDGRKSDVSGGPTDLLCIEIAEALAKGGAS